jgi:Mrp family chromosome partitioning ATPase
MSIANIPGFTLGASGKSADGYPDFLTDALRLVQQMFLVPGGPTAVVFAGLEHQSGCSSICAAVAGTIAKQTGRPVCLLEANLRSPSLAEKFGIQNGPGLSEAIQQDGPIRPFLKQLADGNLWLLPAGLKTKGTDGVLNSSLMAQRIAELKSAFDFVIIDSAPLGESSDAFALCQSTDGVGQKPERIGSGGRMEFEGCRRPHSWWSSQ